MKTIHDIIFIETGSPLLLAIVLMKFNFYKDFSITILKKDKVILIISINIFEKVI